MIIKRAIFSQIIPWLGEKKILIIKGPRQTGKTTLLGQLKEHLEKQDKKCIYFSADQERDNAIFSSARLFIKYLEEQHNLKEIATDKLYVFVDECQYIKDAGLFLKNIFDLKKKQLQLIATGSSSLEITKNSEFLTGRKIDFYLQHFSFKEFLTARADKKYNQFFNLNETDEIKDFHTIYGPDLERHFLDYLNWGGYPEVALTMEHEKKALILKDIVKTYIEKDIALFLKIENIAGFNNLIKILSSQIGNLLNRDELSATLGISKETVKKYLDILVGTYIFSFLPPFFTNKRKEITKMPKIFVSDSGIIKIILNNQPMNDYTAVPGNLAENFVFNELNRYLNREGLFFYRTIGKSEIDFIVSRSGLLTPLEVKFKRKAQTIPVAVKHFNNNYRKQVKKSIILTQRENKVENNTFFLPIILLPFINLD